MYRRHCSAESAVRARSDYRRTTANPREVAYLLGFLSEGENEAALLLALISETLEAQPQTEVFHMIDEAWYYLRTSIDSSWQLDRGEPSVTAALAYLATALERRLARVCSQPVRPSLADDVDADARNFLEGLRSDQNASV